MIKSVVKAKVKSLYPNETWARKVDKMGNAQLYAIYNQRFYLDGTLKPRSPKRQKKNNDIPGQMHMSDYMEM